MAQDKDVVRLRGSTVVLLVADIAATIPWYERNLGFKAKPVPQSPPHTFCILIRDEVAIMLQQLDGYVKPDVYASRAGGVWNAYIKTVEVAAFYKDLSQRPDVRIVQDLCRQPYGQIEFEVVDPNGYVLVFAEPYEFERNDTGRLAR